MTRPYYGHEYVESDVALGWLTRNSGAFVEIVNAENVLVACFGILPLEPSFMDQFIKGRIDDHQIQASDICSYKDGLKCLRLYVSGVIVRDHTKHLGRKRAHVMIWVMLHYASLYPIRLRVEKETDALRSVRNKRIGNPDEESGLHSCQRGERQKGPLQPVFV